MLDRGVYDINEVRRFEDENDIGELGDIRLRSGNLVPVGTPAPVAPAAPAAPATTPPPKETTA
jgi:hypothetical protein